jgi:hypothetical protein
MTGNVTMLLPMLAACCAAMLLRNPPIYDSLRVIRLYSDLGSACTPSTVSID